MLKNVRVMGSFLGTALVVGISIPCWAVDGVVLIDQNKAMAGGVTPGDLPGFPVTISTPGSYRLAGNLVVPDANTDAIVVTSDNVSLDLNGFSISGPTICGRSAGDGAGFVTCSPTGSGSGVKGNQVYNISIKNGTIRGMGSSGISLTGTNGFSAPASTVQKISAVSNGGSGIAVESGLVVNNVTGSNGIWGISTNRASVIGNYITNNNAGAMYIGGAGGYANNVFLVNGFNGGANQSFGGTSLGQNLCGGLGLC